MDNFTPCSLEEMQKTFSENLKKLCGSLTNLLFMLDTDGAIFRKTSLLYLLFVAWGFLTIIMLYGTNVSENLGGLIQQVFQGTGNLDINLITTLFITFTDAILSPFTLIFVPIILFPFVVAYQAAVAYLVDIYELEDPNIAAKFIWQAAFASKYDSISIVEGKLNEEDEEKSPIIRIGGPGIVNVDFCSAVLFEKPDGRPHVIGPTYKPPLNKNAIQKLIDKLKKKLIKKQKPPKGNHVLSAFERYRFAKNLRDEALLPIEVKARTREGIPVTAKDVRLFYSIWRGNPSEEEKKAIYPYRKEAIPHFFYNTSCTVSDLSERRCTLSPVDPMQGIVSGALNSFVAECSLSDFLTAVGEPEKDQLIERAKAYHQEQNGLEIGDSPGLDLEDKKFQTPEFKERRETNPLLTQFAEEFSANNRQKGVVLDWLGTGTWHVPPEVVEEKNEEAQTLTKENKKMGSEKELKKIRNKAKHDEILRLVRLISLEAAKIMYAPNTVHEDFIRQTLASYAELIKNAAFIVNRQAGENTHAEVVSSIYDTFPAHWLRECASAIGGVDTVSPSPKSIQAISEALVKEKDYETDAVRRWMLRRILQRLLRKTKNDPTTVINLLASEKEVTPRLNLIALARNTLTRLEGKL